MCTLTDEAALEALIHTELSEDCLNVIREFMPLYVIERCFTCGVPVIMADARGRLHFEAYVACSEAVIACAECFEILDV